MPTNDYTVLHTQNKFLKKNCLILHNTLLRNYKMDRYITFFSAVLLITPIALFFNTSFFNINGLTLLSLFIIIFLTLTISFYLEYNLLQNFINHPNNEKNSNVIICGENANIEQFNKYINIIRENDLDPDSIWFFEGVIGITRVISLFASLLFFGYMTYLFLKHGIFDSPYIYIFGAIFLIILNKQIDLIYSLIIILNEKNEKASSQESATFQHEL